MLPLDAKMTDGITGEFRTGELSGIAILWKWMIRICHTDSRLHLKLRGRHQKKYVMLSKSNLMTSLSRGSMMNQDVKLQGTYRTLYKLSTKSPFVRVGVYNKYIHTRRST